MGLKSVLSKIGKVALTAAPYIAAPFTGGASLLGTGLANKAVGKWSEHSANENAKKGLAPSSFDRILGKVGNIAGTASMFIPGGQLGALGKGAQVADKVSKVGKVTNILGKVQKGADIAGSVIGAARSGQTPPYLEDSSIMSDDPRRGGIAGMGRNDKWREIFGGMEDSIPSGQEGTTERQPIGPSTDVARNREVLDFGGALARGRRQAIRERPRRYGRRQIMNAY